MPKLITTKKPGTQPHCQPDYHSLHPWQCRHHQTHSDIIAYINASDDWQPVLTAHPAASVSAETMANYIVALVNQHQSKKDVLRDAMNMLESIVNEGLTFDTEQEADIVIEELKKLG